MKEPKDPIDGLVDQARIVPDGQPAAPEATTGKDAFVSTRVAEEIRAVANVAMQLGGIALVCGASGIGKTLALKAIAADRSSAVYVCAETGGKFAAIFKLIGQAMKLPAPGTRHSGHEYYDAVKEALRGTNRLVIVDQIQRLCGIDSSDRALLALSDLQRATEIPMLWAGTPEMLSHLQRRGSFRSGDPMAEVRTRIIMTRDLHERTTSQGGGEPLFTVDEVRRVFARGQLRLVREAEQFLARLANLPGSGALKECTSLVQLATIMYAGRVSALTVAHLEAAQRMLATGSQVRHAQDEMELSSQGGALAQAV